MLSKHPLTIFASNPLDKLQTGDPSPSMRRQLRNWIIGTLILLRKSMSRKES